MRSASATWARVTAVCVARRLQPVLTLVTAFEQVAEADIELLRLVQVFAGKILRAEEWNELGVRPRVGLGRRLAVISCA